MTLNRYRDAMHASIKLMEQDKESALRLLDDAIAMAASENENQLLPSLTQEKSRNSLSCLAS
jgi:hypothetical protein